MMYYAGTDVVDDARAADRAAALARANAPVIMPVAEPPVVDDKNTVTEVKKTAADLATSLAAIKAAPWPTAATIPAMPWSTIVTNVTLAGLTVYGAYKLLTGGHEAKTIGGMTLKCLPGKSKRTFVCRAPWREKAARRASA